MKYLNPLRRLVPLTAAALTLSSTIFAQQQVSIYFSDTSIKTVLREVTKQTGYNFVYSDALVELDKRIDINYNDPNASINSILDRMFDGTDIKYSVSDKQVALLNESIERGSLRSQSPQTPPPAISGQVSGVVRNNATGETISGVTVNVKGTEVYASTDANGVYTIASPPNGVLVFTFVGMLTREIEVASRRNIPVSLEYTNISINEVIVTGYQTLSNERATGSFGSVTADDLEDKLQPDLATILEGQVAGLTVNQHNQIEIRGVSTLNAETSPLIVVDGFPVDASLDDTFFRYRKGLLENINVDNVESITVLKDGVAASIYGARAANGVIVIVTKRGRQGDAQFSYKGVLGYAPEPDMLNLNKASTNDYIDAEIDMFNLNPSNYNITNGTGVLSRVLYLMKQAERGLITQAQADAEIDELRKNDFLGELKEYVYRPRLSHQHNFMVNGGTEKNTYNFAVNYIDTRQNFKYADNDRLTVDIKDEWKFSRFLTVNAAVSVAYSNLQTPTINPDRAYTSGDGYGSPSLFNFHQNSYFTPYTSIADDNGDPENIWGLSPYKQQTYADYDGMMSADYDFLNNISREMIYTKDFQARLTGQAKIFVTDGLTIDMGGNWQRGSYKYQKIQDKDAFAVREAYNDSKSISNNANHYLPKGAVVNENRSNSESWTIRSQVNFNRNFDGTKHRVSALAGNEIRKNTRDMVTLATRAGYNRVAGSFTPVNILDYNSTVYASDMLFGRRLSFATGNYGYRDIRFTSWYGNGSYEYNDRYILSGSVRLDLTNFFGTDPKYRYKPLWSVGGTWKLSKEAFFDVSFVDRLYVRASYGLNGNIKLDQGPFLILNAGSYNNTAQGIGSTISSPPNNQLRWEKTVSTNFGVDASLFDNKLDVTIDLYNKLSSDVLANESVDQTVGYTSVMMNVGKIKNTGIEVSAGADVIDNGDFRWRLSTNFAYNKNTVKEYNVTRATVGNYLSGNGVSVAGYAVNGLWSLRFAPLNSTGNAMIYNAAGEAILSSQALAEDAYYVGPTKPVFDISLTSRVACKNLEFSFMVISKLGHYYLKDAFHSRNIQDKHVGDRWKKPGDEAWAKYPALTVTNTDYWYAPYIDVNVGKASFARVRDMTLTYTFNKALANRIGLGSAKVYLQGRNLITLKPKGMDIDPETMVPYSGGYTGYTDFSFSTFPLPKELYLGLQITF
jgi:TonB-linked SusC/RagA family outer membrane protein